MITINQIKDRLRADEVVPVLFPQAVRTGNEWEIGSIGGDQGKSLKIHRGGDKHGLWSDFSTGEKGDLIE